MVKQFVGIMAMVQFLFLLLSSAQTVLLLTGGGPGNATMTMAYYMYDLAFRSRAIGYSQAIAVLLFVTGFAGMLSLRRLSRPSY
jgi:multiple sugar transport system permease protein